MNTILIPIEQTVNKLYQGDCLEIMPDMPDKSIDMILCDLPYGTTACKWDTIIPLDTLWKEYKRIIKDNGAIVLCGSEPFSSYLRMSNIDWYKYDWVWVKNRIKTYTDKGGLVLDNCAGSGTTGVACINTNRNYILIEKDPEYCGIIEKRCSQQVFDLR